MPSVTRYLTVDGEILSEKRGAAKSDYLPDPLGSTAALLNSSQTKTDSYTYWPYGEERTSSGSTPTPFRYVGTLGYRKDDSSRTYVRARVLNPGRARWMTVDPLWPMEKAYVYAFGNPVSYVDRNGNRPQRGFPGGIEPVNSNYGDCAVYICSEHKFGGIFSGIASHKYVCVTGPYGGCSGGLYPSEGRPWSGGQVQNSDKHCPGGDPATNDSCEKVASGCDLAIGTCACVKKSISHPGNYIFPFRTCYTYPNEMVRCACDSIKDPIKRSLCWVTFSNGIYIQA